MDWQFNARAGNVALLGSWDAGHLLETKKTPEVSGDHVTSTWETSWTKWEHFYIKIKYKRTLQREL